tara:strand:- start:551 stop:787 length:237 start_codon:yes stop_codon:yes gene_type:complete
VKYSSISTNYSLLLASESPNSPETKAYQDQMNFVVDQIAKIPGIPTEVVHNYDHYILHAVVTFAENWKVRDTKKLPAA